MATSRAHAPWHAEYRRDGLRLVRRFRSLAQELRQPNHIDIGTAVETLVTDRWAARKTAAHPTSIGVPSNPRDVTPKYCYTNG